MLRFFLFTLALSSAWLLEVPGAQRAPWLLWLTVGVVIYLVVTSIVLNSLRSVVPMVGFSIADVVMSGLVVIAAGSLSGPAVACMYAFVVLAALGRNLLVGMSAGLTAALLYGGLVLPQLGAARDPNQVILSAIVGVGLCFVMGSVGLIVRRAVQQARKEFEEERGRDRALEDALGKARELSKIKEQRELELFDKQRKLQALMAVSRLLSTARKPEEVLQMMVTKAREEVNAAIGFVMLLRGDELTVEFSSGLSEPTKRVMNTQPGQGLLGEVVERGQSIRLTEREGDPRMLPYRETMERVRSIMAVPLQAPQDKKPIGVLGVANLLVGDGFNEEHEDYLKILASDASISLTNIKLYEDLEQSYFEIIHALAQAIEAKDPYTHGHVGRVRDNAIRLARAMNLSEEDVEIVAKGAILHDVGKISTPNEILNKPGALTPVERKKMDDHVVSSIHILKDIRSLPPEVFEVVLFHHERYDGKGYPYGLRGDEIPIGAQIVSVADAFDAMTSDRPYRKGFPIEKAVDLLRQSAGTQFNPRVLNSFFAMVNAERKATLQLQR